MAPKTVTVVEVGTEFSAASDILASSTYVSDPAEEVTNEQMANPVDAGGRSRFSLPQLQLLRRLRVPIRRSGLSKEEVRALLAHL